jgi:hypothetical protein
MGNALCLASLGGSTSKEQGGVADSTSFVRVSPVHSCKRRISHFSPSKEPASLHALCVTACARALLSGSTLPAQVEALPLDLLQLVLDHIIDAGEIYTLYHPIASRIFMMHYAKWVQQASSATHRTSVRRATETDTVAAASESLVASPALGWRSRRE